MKQSKILKKVSLVALSAVMVSGVTLTAAGCGGGTTPTGNPTTISVNIFCNKADEHTNRTICAKWGEEYSKKMNREVKVNLIVNPKKDAYFEDLGKLWATPSAVADVIYLSPSYVQSYVKNGYVMDLSEYLGAEAGESMGQLWENAVGYYGYNNADPNYKSGQKIVYKADGANGAGFYTESGNSKVGVFGLPKDYSNFSMGYNRRYFSDELKKAYETTLGSTARDVKNVSKVAGQSGYASKYQGYSATNSSNFVATYAATGDYTLSDGTTKHAEAGKEAPIISVGVPVNYKPFNFYRYNDYMSALNAGDPMACAVDAFTDGEGYTVTIPGFPGDTFDIGDQANAKAENVPYDAGIGHTVFTYAEYGALVWAITYYLNTFDWDSATPNAGSGGLTVEGASQVIYGSEQYEGAQGNALYLLPWAASNDADLINEDSTSCVNPNAKADTTTNALELAGDATEDREKMNLDGTTRTAKVQYGFNSKNFIETYGAYQEFGSTWNGNSGNAGDESTTKQNASGWDYFCMGAAVFYGAGTWDAATRNDTEMSVFEFGQMPMPVAEKYALYSNVKDANFDMKEYSNDPKAKETGDGVNNDGAQRANLSAGKVVYSKDEVIANQIKRQDKWAARMDSVGYAANGRFAKMSEDNAEYWKREATASLIMSLTIGKEEQITLTYAGAQLPNYRSQCTEFLRYQEAEYANGSFKDMLTPEGFSTTTDKAEGRRIWDHYYTVAKAMAADSRSTGSKRGLTVAEWIAQSGYKDYDGTSDLRYDTQYANVKLSEFTGEKDTNIGFAMKVLRMVCFTYADRDLNIRMQYGLNSVRDSSMYTANNTWIGTFNASGQATMLAYINQRTLTSAEMQNFNGSALARTIGDRTGRAFWTPAVYCIGNAGNAQSALGKK